MAAARIPARAPDRRHRLLGRAWLAFGRTRAGALYVKRVSPRLDPVLLRATRGRVSSIMVLPLVLLHSTGARSGAPRVTPLVYFTDGDRVVLMASNYGGERAPAWYHNVRAHPEVVLEAGGVRARYRGEEATGEERDRLWELAKRVTRNYEDYERRTAGVRRIPVMVFTPVDAA